MKRNLFIGLFVWLCFQSVSFAETVYLKNGKVVKGRVVEKGSYYIIVQSGDVPNKFFNDQIDRIEPDQPADTNPAIPLNSITNISAVKLDLIRKFIEVNGTRRNIQKNFDQIIAKVPTEKKEEFSQLFQIDEIIEKLVPIYDKYFSDQELTALINFYQSPVGQKAIETTPKIMGEALVVTIQYFEEKLKAQGQ